jgi:DNA adenine methylase
LGGGGGEAGVLRTGSAATRHLPVPRERSRRDLCEVSDWPLQRRGMLLRSERARAAQVRPPFAYFGGKAGLARRIVSLFPPHRVYLEPYFGSGAVLFAKTPAPIEIVNDVDGSVVAFFEMLRDRPGDLERVCRLTPYARDEYEAADLGDPGIDTLERARRFWVRVNQSFAKSHGRRTGWSITTSRSQSCPASAMGRVDRFEACAARLVSVAIEHCDGMDLIRRMATADTLAYVDPTYLESTRAGRDRCRTGDYPHETCRPADHERIARVLHETPATVILSGYPSDLYDALYRDWWTVEIPVTVHSANAAPSSPRGERVERLWSNRPLGGQMAFEEGTP